MKMRDVVRRFFYLTVLAVLGFGPGFAQSAFASPVSTPVLTRTAGTFVLGPFDDWRSDRRKKKKKTVAAAEGGSAALYLLLAGLVCGGALLVRRQPLAEKSV